MRLLVTGSNGQLATEYQLSKPLHNWDCYFVDRQGLDISSQTNVKQTFDEILPDAVLNLAAYTNVEKAEKEETEKAFDANAAGPRILAEECKKRNIPLIHISTDYVFDGTKESAYDENDKENPLNQYGRTKFLGEKWIQESHDWYYILRTSWVYSNHSKNFFNAMLKLAQERSELNVVDDQYGSPTSTKELCRAIDAILSDLSKEKSGVYHFSGLGKTNWKDFAIEIFSQTNVAVTVQGVRSSSWPSKVIRPVNSYMTSKKFSENFNYTPAHWKNALREVISERKIVPVKVGDVVSIQGIQHVIVSTDWLKRLARISVLENIEKSFEIAFDELILK
jgi:dTDP-4-dehydrorhamnose reductase